MHKDNLQIYYSESQMQSSLQLKENWGLEYGDVGDIARFVSYMSKIICPLLFGICIL